MLSLVNYGSSDEDDNISDEEEVVAKSNSCENGVNNENSNDHDSFLEKSSKINLPLPKSSITVQSAIPEEDDDEFLHKKAIPQVVPQPKVKQKVKIMIPKLSDFRDNDEDENDKKFPGPSAPNKRTTGLLGMLPKPTHSLSSSVNSKPPSSIPAPIINQKPSTSIESCNTAKTSTNPQITSNQEVKKIGMIPYTLMEHNKKTAESNKKPGKRKGKDSDDSDDDTNTPFFSFDTNEDLPQVNEEEIKAMVEREANRIELRKIQAEASNQIDDQIAYSQHYKEQQDKQESNAFDEEAMKALVGGSKAKRSKMEDIQIMDLSDQDVLPNKDDWIRKNLAGETSYVPTGKIDEKGPALAKRKHQISYLALRAEKNISELEAMWAANRQNNREGRSKYGF